MTGQLIGRDCRRQLPKSVTGLHKKCGRRRISSPSRDLSKIFLVSAAEHGKVMQPPETSGHNAAPLRYVYDLQGVGIMTVFAVLLLLIAVTLFAGTILVYLKAALSDPSWVEHIRRLRQEGLAVNQEGGVDSP